jgi:hypothetical protein
MAFSLDYSTDNGKVRLLISDIDEQEPVFPYGTEASPDDAIDAFIGMALDNNVKRAAAQALLSIAVNETLVQKRIKILDLSTDGPAEAAVLRQLAADLMAQADNEEIDGAFDWAEQINTPAQWDEFTFKDRLRT